MKARVRAVGVFVLDFIVGDDWRAAVGIAVALAITWTVSLTPVPAWWILPAAVALLLALGVRRACRPRPPRPADRADPVADPRER